MVDTRKYGSGFIKPDDLRDGPRQERIVNVFVSDGKYDNLVLDLASGDQLSLNTTTTRILNRAYGTESDYWRDYVIELSLGSYTNKEGETKETVAVKPISERKPDTGNGVGAATQVLAKPASSLRKDMDEIPFI